MLKASILLFVALALSVSSATAQHHYSDAERRIISLVDEERGTDSVAMYLHDRNPDVAWRAAIGLANLRDTTIRPKLIQAFLAEHRDTVSDAEAFTLGVLGDNAAAANALLEKAKSRASLEIMRALGRTAPSSADVCQYFVSDAAKASMQVPIAAMLVEFGLRQHYSEAMGKIVDLLAESNSPDARWRAAYTFSRLKDSAGVANHLPALRELLNDQGSEYARMFAANSIARINSPESIRILEVALKSEPAWRVRVNLFNALARAPHFDSTMFSELRRTVDVSRDEDPTTINLATSALRAIQQMVMAGKFTSQDSSTLGAWLADYNGMTAEHSEIPKLVQATASVLAAELLMPNTRLGIENFAQTKDYVLRNLAVEGAAFVKDTFYFGGILVSMPVSSPKEQLNRLESLARLWDLAKKDTLFMGQLERTRIASVYRHLVLHAPEVVQEPEVVIPALSAWSDSTILNTAELRREAAGLLPVYIVNFANADHRDQLVAAVTNVIVLRPDTAGLMAPLTRAARFAAESSDRELLDTLKKAFEAIHVPWPNYTAAPHVSSIDWNELESLPNTLLLNFTKDIVELDLLPYYAPITALRMVKLAKIAYFANQPFHRVVPNFVIQSGDPTGSGWGGPGYMMRTEVAPIAYDTEGMVGMASSGLNTEGSQWFITECPTPHLSTRYTIFGRVRKGMDKVFKVVPGEKLENITPFNRK